MLVLTRKMLESVVIGESEVEVVVLEISGSRVKLGFRAPEGISVLRKEVDERLRRQRLKSQEVRPSEKPS